jgi:hypothetical protein
MVRQMVPLRIPLLALLILIPITAAQAAMDCPAPPQNAAKELVNDTEASASGLGKLVGGSLKNKTEVTVKNLFEKYPNADKITFAQILISQFCQQIAASTTLSDAEKLDRLQTENQTIISIIAGSH